MKLKKTICSMLQFVGACYGVLTLWALCTGIWEVTLSNPYKPACEIDTPLEYMFPARRVGCWLAGYDWDKQNKGVTHE